MTLGWYLGKNYLGVIFITRKWTGDVWLRILWEEMSGEFGVILVPLCFYGEIRGNSVLGVRIPVQDYKSLCLAVMISATLVNTQTHTRTHRQISTRYTISSERRATKETTVKTTYKQYMYPCPPVRSRSLSITKIWSIICGLRYCSSSYEII